MGETRIHLQSSNLEVGKVFSEESGDAWPDVDDCYLLKVSWFV